MEQDFTYNKIKLNGEEHILKMNFNAIRNLEKEYDRGIFGIIREEQMGLNLIAAILWSGLLWKNPNLEVKHVADLIDQDIESNDDFDFEKLSKFAMKLLTESKIFKLLSNGNKKDKETKNDQTA